MNWYIRTVKEANYVLSEPYETLEEAEIKLQHLHKKKRESAVIVAVPNIKAGLILYKNNGEYYKTIVNLSNSIILTKINPEDDLEISDPILPEHLINWFITNKIDNTKEQYNTNIKYRKIQEIGENITGLKEEEEN